MSFDLIALGRLGVDLYPQQAGPLHQVSTFAKSVGGSAANVAVAAARLGRRSALVSMVGKDPFGLYLGMALEQFGVDVRWVSEHPDAQTPIVVAELDPPEDPNLTFYRRPKAPDLHIEIEDLDDDALAQARIVWVTGTGLSVEPSRRTTLHAMRASGDEGQTIFDLDYRAPFWSSPDDARAQLHAAIKHADVVVGNREEARIAVGTDDPHDAASRLLELGVQLAIVKLGGDGVLVATAEGCEEVPPIRVDVVCGLGAGDAFGGALCHALLAGWSAVRAVRFANAAGAIVASRLACADAMPTVPEIEALLEGSHVA